MNRPQTITWIILTAILALLGLGFAFFTWQTAVAGLLVYLPLTAVLSRQLINRRRGLTRFGFFGLWLLLYLAWLTYIGPLVGRLSYFQEF